ncbi:MAG: dephospho-CoA kinase [Actinomycetales bacterium]|nr:MAG: dephospho-CoA kinase [Actinomycetales bacterium]
MLRVGLTGGIGSGKSTVAMLLRELGAAVTDADQLAREIVEPGRPALGEIEQRFGPDVIRDDGSLDRAGLASIVFSDRQALEALEAITGPAIAALAERRRRAVPRDQVDVYDMPLLVEKSEWVHEHLTMVVGADEEVRLRRLVDQRRMPEADARSRIAAQANDVQRREAADIWVDNNGSRDDTVAQVRSVWQARVSPYHRNLLAGRRATRPDRLRLSDPDPGWADAGARVVARIAHALAGRGVSVEHIGSTSVPGLPAQDVVDVHVGVHRLGDADDPGFVAALTAAGYVSVEDAGSASRGRRHHPAGVDAAASARVFGGSDPGRIVDVRVCEVGSAAYLFALSLRDWLRAEPAARAEYAAEKLRLASRLTTIDEYAAAKDIWFDTVSSRVATWTDTVGWRP